MTRAPRSSRPAAPATAPDATAPDDAVQSGDAPASAPAGPALQFGEHDHSACVEHVLGTLEAQVRARGLRLTPVRKRVLAILLESHVALGAYDILRRLGEEGMAAQPPVAYRALDFLMREGFVHKIERLNAFVACCSPAAEHDPAFLVCRGCRRVAEAEAAAAKAAVAPSAAAAGFAVERAVVEVIGLCPACAESGAA